MTETMKEDMLWGISTALVVALVISLTVWSVKTVERERRITAIQDYQARLRSCMEKMNMVEPIDIRR